MSELNKFTRLFINVKRCKGLNWQEKAILSEIISYQLDGKPFKLKDITLALELAMDKGTVSKFINRLAKKGVLNKTTVPYLSPSGGKPKRLRTVTVVDIDSWTSISRPVPVIANANEERAEATTKTIDLKELSVVVKQTPQPKEKVVPPSKNNDSDLREYWLTLTESKDLSPMSKKQLKDGILEGSVKSETQLRECFIKMKELDLKDGF